MSGSAVTVTGRSSARGWLALANPLAVLVAPLEDLVGVDSVLTCHAGNRCTRHQRRLNDPKLALRRAIESLRSAASRPNFYSIAHKEIVGYAGAHVYTARPGRLQSCASRNWSNLAVVAP